MKNALDYVQGVHPAFNRERAEQFLASTDVKLTHKVRQLSKGMVTQLHLALVLAIKARLLVLDEPTLGLDLLVRRRFYDTLLNDYMDEERTILVTTHQVEEIENLLTDVMFIEQGRIVLDTPVDQIGERYAQLIVKPEQLRAARALQALQRAQPCWVAPCCSTRTRRVSSWRRWGSWAHPPSPTCSWRSMQKEAA